MCIRDRAGPNGIVGTTADVILDPTTAEDAGEYTVTITINGCPNSLDPVTVAIAPRPATPTIMADNTNACPGESLTLTTGLAEGDNITYDWLLNGQVVATTTDPSLEIMNFQEENAGDYTVIVSDGACPSEESEPISISLQESLEGVTASSNSPVCIGESINLMVTEVEGATYEWTGPNGFSSTEQNPTIDNATEADAGDYSVTVTVDGCPATIPPAMVVVTPQPPAPTVSINNSPVCEGVAGTVTITDPVDGTTYTVIDAAGNTVASGMGATVDVPTDGLEGVNTFTVIAQEDGGCPSEPSNPVDLDVMPIPDEQATILSDPMGDQCGLALTTVEATPPTQGIGTWTSNNPDVIFVDPNSSTTEVMGLEDGDMVTWTLSNDACGEYASASITINAMMPVTTANDDAITILNTETATLNVTGNDSPSGGVVTVISGPANGVGAIDANGNLTYTPNPGFTGIDQIVYELCNPVCPDAPCDQATVTITVNQGAVLCDNVPDVISPNGDGLNDALVIPCADFQSVGLRIFNRWGDLIFETDNYNNDWAGTWEGEDLPPGPYYYIFEEDGVEPRTGCVSIAR